jgi:hypothetical protein
MKIFATTTLFPNPVAAEVTRLKLQACQGLRSRLTSAARVWLEASTKLICIAVFFLCMAGVTAQAADADLKLEAQLVLCSNSTQPKGQPVEPEIERKLLNLPLKWQHYYVVTSQTFSVAKNQSKPVVLGKSAMAVKNLGGERVEVTLIGHGKITQSLRKGQTLVTNSNDDACLIVVRQLD